MRLFELVSKKAFTLIEVMIAVMIVSVVIAALFKLQGDTNHLFKEIQKNQKESSYATFLLWNRTYGFNKSNLNLYRLVDNFDLDDDLRRELKNIKAEIIYTKQENLEVDDLTFEIGTTRLHTQDFDLSFKRIQLR